MTGTHLISFSEVLYTFKSDWSHLLFTWYVWQRECQEKITVSSSPSLAVSRFLPLAFNNHSSPFWGVPQCAFWTLFLPTWWSRFHDTCTFRGEETTTAYIPELLSPLGMKSSTFPLPMLSCRTDSHPSILTLQSCKVWPPSHLGPGGENPDWSRWAFLKE